MDLALGLFLTKLVTPSGGSWFMSAMALLFLALAFSVIRIIDRRKE